MMVADALQDWGSGNWCMESFICTFATKLRLRQGNVGTGCKTDTYREDKEKGAWHCFVRQVSGEAGIPSLSKIIEKCRVLLHITGLKEDNGVRSILTVIEPVMITVQGRYRLCISGVAWKRRGIEVSGDNFSVGWKRALSCVLMKEGNGKYLSAFRKDMVVSRCRNLWKQDFSRRQLSA